MTQEPLIPFIVFTVLFAVLRLFFWALILSAIISTLISFNVLDTRNRAVWTIADFLYRLTEPVLRPIRRVLPDFAGVDLSPLAALLIIQIVVTPVLAELHDGFAFGVWRPLF